MNAYNPCHDGKGQPGFGFSTAGGGKDVEVAQRLDGGHRLRVKLVSVDIDQGFIDSVRV